MNDFSKKTLSSLSKKGIYLIGLTIIPGPSAAGLSFANGERGYLVNHNGTGRVLTFSEMLEAAG